MNAPPSMNFDEPSMRSNFCSNLKPFIYKHMDLSKCSTLMDTYREAGLAEQKSIALFKPLVDKQENSKKRKNYSNDLSNFYKNTKNFSSNKNKNQGQNKVKFSNASSNKNILQLNTHESQDQGKE